MKLGAKVPEAGLLRPELDLSRFALPGDNVEDICETEELRRCPLLGSNPLDGVIMADFGRVWKGVGDGEERPNRLVRFGEPLAPFS